MTELKFILAMLLVVSSNALLHAQSAVPQKPLVPTNAIPARAIEDPSVRAGWRRYEIGTTPALGVILPSVPANTVEIAGGQDINTYVSTNESGVYAAVRIDRLPMNLESASPEARSRYFQSFFEGFARGFQKGLGPSVKESLALLEVTQVMTTAGRNGYQQRLTLGTMQGRSQMVFVGNSAFALVALWLPSAPAADYDSFFGSFRIK